MKQIAIIGAGIAGLRAALELAPQHRVTIYEKSPGVGGRVATRRLTTTFINHGAHQFDGQEMIKPDPLAAKFARYFSFDEGATLLPKAMRDMLQKSKVNFRLNTRVLKIIGNEIYLETGERKKYDAFILTAPIPQVRELLAEEKLYPEVTYQKALIFIGERDGLPVLWNVPHSKTEECFDLSEDEIRERFTVDLTGLTLKKWRYSRVEIGVPELFGTYHPNILIAGDAFDPERNHHIGASWLSGLAAGRALL